MNKMITLWEKGYSKIQHRVNEKMGLLKNTVHGLSRTQGSIFTLQNIRNSQFYDTFDEVIRGNSQCTNLSRSYSKLQQYMKVSRSLWNTKTRHRQFLRDPNLKLEVIEMSVVFVYKNAALKLRNKSDLSTKHPHITKLRYKSHDK